MKVVRTTAFNLGPGAQQPWPRCLARGGGAVLRPSDCDVVGEFTEVHGLGQFDTRSELAEAMHLAKVRPAAPHHT